MKRFFPILAFTICLTSVLGWAETDEADNAPAAPADSAAAPETTVTPIEAAAAPETPASEPTATEPESSPATEVASASPAAESAQGTHKVAAGDTLWGIAGSLLKDPYQWTKIWEANKSLIANPDLIFPDQEFVIPSLSAAEAMAAAPAPVEAPAGESSPVAEVKSSPAEEPAAEPAAAPQVAAESPAPAAAPSQEAPAPEEAAVEPEAVEPEAPPAPALTRKGTPGAGFMGGTADAFLAGPDWEYDGYILRDRDQKMMISQGDIVFLNVGASAGVQQKMYGQVYRLGKKVKDPYLKRTAGKMMIRVGTVMVTSQVTDEACTAVVTNSLEPIRAGDLIKFESR